MNNNHLRTGLCGFLVALGGAVAVGWIFDIGLLKSLAPSLAAMKFNVALSFLVAGVAIYAAGFSSKGTRRIAVAGGALLLAIGCLTLVQYGTGLDFGIDQFFIADRDGSGAARLPGRMSPLTALAWVAIGTASILIAAGRRPAQIAAGHFLSVAAGFIAFLAASGYAFGAEAFWGVGFYATMAIHTAIGLLVAVAAILLTRAGEGWLSGFSDAPAARSLLVQLVPVALLLPLALGFVLLLGSGLGAYNAAFGFALFVPFATIALTAVALLLAKQARSSERIAYDASLALRLSEERYRRIFEQTSDLILTADLNQVINDCNPSAAAAVGLTREQAVGRKISDFVSPEDFDQTTSMLRRKLEQGGTTRYDIRVRSSRGEWLFWEINSGLTFADDGTPIGLHVVGRDITERKRAEEHQSLLINELNHRVKNTLAVVQSIAHQTLRNGSVAPKVREALEGRLAALSAAHNVLTRENWSSASMREIAGDALAPFCAGNRCTIEGPDIRLDPRSAVSLALAFHELATNASKYGALQTETGEVLVCWSLNEGRVTLEWRERGGPPVEPPAKRGFGSRMIERGLSSDLGGSARLLYEPEGLICRLEFPVDDQKA